MFYNPVTKSCLHFILLLLFFLFPLLGWSQVKTGNPVIKNTSDSSLAPTEDALLKKVDSLLNKGDSLEKKPDTILRIKNFSPYFTLHVDSTIDYQFEINKDPKEYYWYLKNSPMGLRINKDNGTLHFKADKSYFLSGKLKYDNPYKVQVGIQNLDFPKEKIDTFFTLVFYNTEIIPSRLKPSISNDVIIDEGDTLEFNIQCEEGSFPILSITYTSNYPIKSLSTVDQCGDEFKWVAPYDFIKDDDNEKVKAFIIKFIGVDKWMNHDTAAVKVLVKQSINFPFRMIQYDKTYKEIETYIIQLKSTFRILDQKIRHTKNTRTAFDLTSASTALGGTIFSSMPDQGAKATGTILPSVGVALVPVKEAVSPAKNDIQNSASLVRSDIKRLQYLLGDNALVGEKDPDIIRKTQKLRDELTQVQLQLIDVPVVEDSTDSKALDEYFNNPKVNKKYRLK
jgi:hypothetical protein